ncbi:MULTISPECIES: CpaD family pilus assembly protein [Sphingomonas]|uniref:Pilus assembly protein CpaD n=1 Tax=Sphingomonas kyeonggiensis TaxID=1268553 RepID=A0A7W7K4L5_9SPHN|nr:CpaD family pilus assembly lipoprotein [Sphingomonas kyeonggiensis]MBB4840523.1 pilus assembly protein CpaD [Sphingomonas kyeonggiensis]
MLPRFTPLLVPALLLAGCGTYNGGVESVHQPVVQRNDYVLDLQTTGYGLAAGESQRLAGWMSAMNLRYGDRVAIDDGAAGTTGRQEIAAEAGRYGLILADRAPVTAGQIAPGTIRVVVTRMTAAVPGCPDNSRPAEYTFEASTSSNYGCSTNANLAAMIADPADLVRGAPGSPTGDPATSAKAIGAFRTAAPSGAGGATLNSGGSTPK